MTSVTTPPTLPPLYAGHTFPPLSIAMRYRSLVRTAILPLTKAFRLSGVTKVPGPIVLGRSSCRTELPIGCWYWLPQSGVKEEGTLENRSSYVDAFKRTLSPVGVEPSDELSGLPSSCIEQNCPPVSLQMRCRHPQEPLPVCQRDCRGAEAPESSSCRGYPKELSFAGDSCSCTYCTAPKPKPSSWKRCRSALVSACSSCWHRCGKPAELDGAATLLTPCRFTGCLKK